MVNCCLENTQSLTLSSNLRWTLFLDVRKRRLVVTDVSVQPTSPIFKRQAEERRSHLQSGWNLKSRNRPFVMEPDGLTPSLKQPTIWPYPGLGESARPSYTLKEFIANKLRNELCWQWTHLYIQMYCTKDVYGQLSHYVSLKWILILTTRPPITKTQSWVSCILFMSSFIYAYF